jgi:hypothetical protein
LQENPELKTRDIVSKAVAIKEFLECPDELKIKGKINKYM